VNQLPDSFRQPHLSCLDSPPHPLVNPPISVIITTLIIHHSFTLSLQAQNLPFQQILPTSIDLWYPLDCPHGLRDWTGLITLTGLFLVRFSLTCFCLFREVDEAGYTSSFSLQVHTLSCRIVSYRVILSSLVLTQLPACDGQTCLYLNRQKCTRVGKKTK